MKMRTKSLLLAVFLVFLLLGTAVAEKITIRSDLWPPYNGEPNSNTQGYMILTLSEIFKTHGDTIDYQLLSWEESLEAVQKGEFNAVVGAAKDDAPDFIFPTEPFGMSDTAFFVKKGSSWKYAGIDSLAKVRLGIIEEYSYNEDLDKYIEENSGTDRIYTAGGDDPLSVLVAMLQKGEIDVIAEDTNVMLHTMINLKVPMGSLVSAGRGDEITPIYVAFSPANPKSKNYANIFDDGIRELRKNGKLLGILQLYGLKDWKTP